MPNALVHRVFAVLFLLAFLQWHEQLNPFNGAIAIAVAILFAGGTLNISWKKFGLSPDVDLVFWHRNPLFHSIILPGALYWTFPNLYTQLILLAWGSHVLLDLFTARGRPKFSPSPKNWELGLIGFGIAAASAIITLLIFVGFLK